MDTHKFGVDYLDLNDQPVKLTKDELDYFRATVTLIKDALDVTIPIYNRDHERDLGGKHKNALGIFYTSDPQDPNADCFITIDNFFIHECFEEKFKGAWNLSFKSLEDVICHEVAHMTQFRHCKRHEAITEELLRKVEDYRGQANKPSLDAQIAGAAVFAVSKQQVHKKTHISERM